MKEQPDIIIPAELDKRGHKSRERKCVALNEVRDPAQMIRFVVGPDDKVYPDILGKVPGRGTWVSASREDLDMAIAKGGFKRCGVESHLNDDGIMKMRRVDGIALPHGKAVELKPGGFHIMLFETSAALGEDAVLTLDFEKAEDLTVVAPIILRGEAENGSHSKASDHGSHSGR